MKISITLFLALVGTGFAGPCEDKCGQEKAMVIHQIKRVIFLVFGLFLIFEPHMNIKLTLMRPIGKVTPRRPIGRAR